MRSTKKQLVDRQLDLCDYFNGMKSGACSKTAEELLGDLPQYNNRKALYRDLKALEERNYIAIKVDTYTPVSISGGTAKQFVRKNRVITFRPSNYGLMTLPTKRMPGDLLGVGIYKGETIYYYSEKREQSKWILSWDHSLIRNPDYIEI